jgi:hypothetical protein
LVASAIELSQAVRDLTHGGFSFRVVRIAGALNSLTLLASNRNLCRSETKQDSSGVCFIQVGQFNFAGAAVVLIIKRHVREASGVLHRSRSASADSVYVATNIARVIFNFTDSAAGATDYAAARPGQVKQRRYSVGLEAEKHVAKAEARAYIHA